VRRVVGKLVERGGVYDRGIGQLAEVLTGPANLLDGVDQHRRLEVLRSDRFVEGVTHHGSRLGSWSAVGSAGPALRPRDRRR
jgi:hypothetical protein